MHLEACLLVKPAASLDGSRPTTALTQEEQRASWQRPNGESPRSGATDSFLPANVLIVEIGCY